MIWVCLDFKGISKMNGPPFLYGGHFNSLEWRQPYYVKSLQYNNQI